MIFFIYLVAAYQEDQAAHQQPVAAAYQEDQAAHQQAIAAATNRGDEHLARVEKF